MIKQINSTTSQSYEGTVSYEDTMASVTLDATAQIPLYFSSSLHTILTLTIMVQSYS